MAISGSDFVSHPSPGTRLVYPVPYIMMRKLRQFHALTEKQKRRRILHEVSQRSRDLSPSLPVGEARTSEVDEIPPHADYPADSLSDDNSTTDSDIDSCGDNISFRESCDSNMSEETEVESDLMSELAQWAAREGIHHSKVNSLLQILRKHPCFSDVLPADSRTLLCTPRQVTLDPLGSGSYYHVGLETSLMQILKNNVDVRSVDTIRLLVSIDGLPLAKSSGSQFWPILVSLTDFRDVQVSVIGLYHGYEKPADINTYLRKFVTEANTLCNVGISFQSKIFKIEISAFVCDAPARAFVSQIKGHTGYSGCGKCRTIGLRLGGRMCFPELNAPLRTDEDFLNRTDPEHNTGISPLVELDGVCNQMVSKFPYEYMHLVCLGVMKKFIHLSLKGNVNVRISPSKVASLSSNLMHVSPYISRSDFARKPRPISEYLRYKASEFRQILLYTGPFIFQNVLPKPTYMNFLVLSHCLRALVAKEPCVPTYYVKELLKNFVYNFGVLFGKEHISYNVHGLAHLVNDYEKHGSLDSFSAFKFESKLQFVKKLLRKGDKPLQQVVKRISEASKSPSVTSECKVKQLEFQGNPFNFQCDRFFKRFVSEHGTLESISPNNCVILENKKIVFVEAIGERSGQYFVVGKEFTTVLPFYKSPEMSTTVYVYKASDISLGSNIWPLKSVQFKAVAIPHLNVMGSYYVAALLHARLSLWYVFSLQYFHSFWYLFDL